jgi:hypothetical protein
VLLRAIEDAFARGDDTLDLGAAASRTRSLRHRRRRVVWSVVPLAGPRLPVVLGDVARRARRALRDRVRGAAA